MPLHASATVTGLAAGTYRFRVSTVNYMGATPSAASAPVRPRADRTLEYLLNALFTRKLAHKDSKSPGAIIIKYPAYSFPTIFLGYIVWSVFRHLFLLKKNEIDPAPEDDDDIVPEV